MEDKKKITKYLQSKSKNEIENKGKKDSDWYKGWGQSKKTIEKIDKRIQKIKFYWMFFDFIEEIMVKGESKGMRQNRESKQ